MSDKSAKRDAAYVSPTAKELRDVASGFAVDVNILVAAMTKIRAASKLDDDNIVSRLVRLNDGLCHELGGQESLQRWMRSENLGLDGQRPVDLLTDGDIDVLERVRDALRGLQFS